MNRTVFLVLAILVIAGGLGAYVAMKPPAGEAGPVIRPGRPDETKTGDPGSKEKSAAAPSEKTLFDGWGTPPAALLLSGEQQGRLEPCGCSEKQLGGLSRRMDLGLQLKQRGWSVAGVDLGGSLHTKRPTRRQSKMKFEVALTALKDMNYRVLALGREELLQGLDLLTYHQPEQLAFVSANARMFPSDLGIPTPMSVFELNGVKIGVTAALGESQRREVVPAVPKPEDQKTGGEIDVIPAEQALAEVLPKLKAEQPQILILISQGTVEEGRALAQKFPEFDLVVSTGGPEDPDPRPELIGKTMFFTVGLKGKHTGVAGLYPSEPAGQRIKYELVDLDKDRYPGAARMTELMKLYQEQLASLDLAVNEPAISHPTGATFTGAEACGKCHTKALAKWKTTKHAHAFESLATGRKGEEATWISRTKDPECLACHVVGWEPQDILRFEGGFRDETSTPHLKGQQCENCHGPGSVHAQEEETWVKTNQITPALIAARKAMHLDQKTAEEKVCHQCHDLDNSPKFQFTKYWQDVAHPGRD